MVGDFIEQNLLSEILWDLRITCCYQANNIAKSILVNHIGVWHASSAWKSMLLF